MNKRVLLNAVLMFALTIFCSYKNEAKKQDGITEKPNFLFIFTDDQTYNTIHALNNKEIKTPNLDRLSREGITFTHCFNQGAWSGAVCVASRTMLITGQTVFRAAQNTRYLDVKTISHEKEKEDVALWQETFRKNGYLTFLTGKWHNSDYAALKSFDRAVAIGKGMYETFDKNGSSEPGYHRASRNTEWKPWDTNFGGHWTPAVRDIVYNENNEKTIGKQYTVNKHTVEVYTENAVKFLNEEARTSEKPFFMFVSFNSPHDPRQAPKEYVDEYPIDAISVPKNFLPEHPFDQGDHNIRDEMLAPFPRTKTAVQLHISEYYALISYLDKNLGDILDALEASGKAANTYVIFSSDHGLAVGQHGLMGKQNQYDHSIRMPLIFRGPHLSKGKKVDNNVYLQSLFATTCDMAGITIPGTVDFKSINGLLNGETQGGEKYIFGTYKNFQRMIRSDDYKLIVYPEAKRIQLFDLVNDPLETNNLASDKGYQKIKEDLFKVLLFKQKELGDQLILNVKDYL